VGTATVAGVVTGTVASAEVGWSSGLTSGAIQRAGAGGSSDPKSTVVSEPLGTNVSRSRRWISELLVEVTTNSAYREQKRAVRHGGWGLAGTQWNQPTTYSWREMTDSHAASQGSITWPGVAGQPLRRCILRSGAMSLLPKLQTCIAHWSGKQPPARRGKHSTALRRGVVDLLHARPLRSSSEIVGSGREAAAGNPTILSKDPRRVA
jgi:hypothetical protein